MIKWRSERKGLSTFASEVFFLFNTALLYFTLFLWDSLRERMDGYRRNIMEIDCYDDNDFGYGQCQNSGLRHFEGVVAKEAPKAIIGNPRESLAF